jgi:predicted phage terminase large subunit-like protein
MKRIGEWDLLVIPATAPEAEDYRIGPGELDVHKRLAGEVLLPDREPQDVLDEMRRAIGSMNYAAQYMQDPVPPGGNVIQREWIRYFEHEPDCFDLLVASWDLASTIGEASSFSVGLLWGVVGPNYYLLEVIRDRLEAPELRRRVIRSMTDWQPHATIVEDTELGRSLVQEIRSTTDLRPLLSNPRLDKTARLLAQAARFEAGQVHVPESAPWLATYLRELLAFPYGRHDDQVDATSQALHHLTARAAKARPIVRRNPERRNVERR